MNNGDRIRSMSNEELARFIFHWQVNLISEVFKNGFVNTLDFLEMKEWLESKSKPHDIFEKWEGDSDDGKEKAD